MANEVKHLQMTDGTICDLPKYAGAYGLEYSINYSAFEYYKGISPTLMPTSFKDLVTGETVTSIPADMVDCSLILIKIAVMGGGNILINATKNFTWTSNNRVITSFVHKSDTSKYYAGTATLTVTTGQLDLKLEISNIIGSKAIDTLITVNSDFSLSFDYAIESDLYYFDNGFRIPKVLFSPASNEYLDFERMYFTDDSGTKINKSLYAFFRDNAGSNNYFKLVMVFYLTLGSTPSKFALTLRFKDTNSSTRITYDSLTFTSI